MKIVEFEWRPTSHGVQGTIRERVLSARMGDGYEQVAGDGLNPVLTDWSVMFRRGRETILLIDSFLRARRGVEPFRWVTPRGDVGLFRARDVRVSTEGRRVMSLSATFVEVRLP